MMNDSSISVDKEGQVKITGEMTFNSTPSLYKELASHHQSKGQNIAIDLCEVGRADSSGLALLLEWQAVARQQNRTLQIINAPDDLLRLAKLCEADVMLDITGR
jgi:anti-anti-sigma factor